jgi:transcriptional regulator with XRE-family HTH domain
MPRAGLTPEQNERVREFVRTLLRDHGGSQAALARKMKITQPTLWRFLEREAGTTYFLVQRLAALLEIPEWKVLGDPPPLDKLPPRELAAVLARQIGVSERAINEVLAEPLTPASERWYALEWTDRMRQRQHELLRQPPPPPPPGRKRKGRV